MRAAGDSDHYTFGLNYDKKLETEIKLTSVTTILRSVFGAAPHVVTWATRFGSAEELKQYRDMRSAEGTAAHAYAEDYIGRVRDGRPTVAPDTGFERAFVKFVEEKRPVFSESEAVVFSLKHAYAGTLDACILETGGAVRVVDFKTRNPKVYQAYDSDKLQCAAYYLAAVEMGLIHKQVNPQIGVLLLKTNGRYTWIEAPAPVDAWLRTLDLYEALKEV